MRVLLDTHTFLWWNGARSKLSPRADAILRSPGTDLLLSAASLWEFQIKHQLSKLALAVPLAQLILDFQQRYTGTVLPIDSRYVLALSVLPMPHRDPFDRMLAAQTMFEGIDLLSADPIFSRYPVSVIW